MNRQQVQRRLSGMLRYGDTGTTEMVHGVFCLLVFVGLPKVFFWTPEILYAILIAGVLLLVAGNSLGSLPIRNLGTVFCTGHHLAALVLLHIKIPVESLPTGACAILWYGLAVFLWLGWKVNREDIYRRQRTKRKNRGPSDA